MFNEFTALYDYSDHKYFVLLFFVLRTFFSYVNITRERFYCRSLHWS